MNISYASHEAVEVRRHLHGDDLLLRHPGLQRAGQRARHLSSPTKAPNGTAACSPSTRSPSSKKSGAATSRWTRQCPATGRQCASRSKNMACATATRWRSRRQRRSPTSSAAPSRSSRCTNTSLSNPTSPESSRSPISSSSTA